MLPSPTWKAACEPVDPDMLRYLEIQGGVGGAITFDRGVILRVAEDRWELAVTTAVHPNNNGYTREDVATVWYFESHQPGDSVEFMARRIARSDAAGRCLAPHLGSTQREVFDPACERLPSELADWIDTNSWEYSKTHPSGKGWMVSSGIGERGFRYWVAVVPVKENVGYKSWSWAPRPDGSTYHVMPVPKNWDGSSGNNKNRTGAPWPSQAQKAAVECLR